MTLRPHYSLFLLLALVLGACREDAPPPPKPTATPSPPQSKGRVLFTHKGDLHICDPAGTHMERLTFGTGVWFPAVSWDGLLVSFWTKGSNQEWALAIMDIEGKGLRQIYFPKNSPMAGPGQHLSTSNAPSFSPDNSQVIFGVRGDIWRVDLAGRNPETLVHLGPDILATSPVLSKDAKTVFYLSNQGTSDKEKLNLWRLDLDTHIAKKLLDLEDRSLGGLRRSPAGDHLAFSINREGKSNIAVFDIKKNTHTPLTKDKGSYAPYFSPDGKKIIFNQEDGQGLVRLLVGSKDKITAAKPLGQITGYMPLWSKAPGPRDHQALMEYEIRHKGRIDPRKPTSVPSPKADEDAAKTKKSQPQSKGPGPIVTATPKSQAKKAAPKATATALPKPSPPAPSAKPSPTPGASGPGFVQPPSS